MKSIFILLLPILACCQSPTSKWEITPFNNSNTWNHYGLETISGLCTWTLRSNYHNLNFKLYSNETFNDYLQITIRLNSSVNKKYPFYNGKALVIYQPQFNGLNTSDISNIGEMTYIFLNNKTLKIIQKHNQTLQIQMKYYGMSAYLQIINCITVCIKIALFSYLFFRISTVNISKSFIYCLLGLQLKIHLELISTNSEKMNIITGWLGFIISFAAILFLLYTLPKDYQRIQGLFYLFYINCISFLLPLQNNLLLFSLILIFQIRFNMVQNKKQSAPKVALALYIIDLGQIMYPIGCPTNIFLNSVNYSVCLWIWIVAGIQIYILSKQAMEGPFLCFRQLIKGKDYNYLQYIQLRKKHFNTQVINVQQPSNGVSDEQQICSLCSKPLQEYILAEHVQISKDDIKLCLIMKTPCNHRYHKHCLKKWLQNSDCCPMDKQAIPHFYE